ncbi:hypothetical protein AB0L40_03935 [Patulibacter sp. NPDC049589]|uniref:hypothetical protein n=1 Tax=Patulibacter sp. NPDC049589 TaxID=3154731 RepID=UPI00342105E1
MGLASVLAAAAIVVAVASSGDPARAPAPPDPAAPTGQSPFQGDSEADAFSNDTRLWIGAGQVGGAPTLAGDNVVQTRTRTPR